MKRKILSAIRQACLLLTGSTLLSSCATVISGTSARITIEGEVDEPVTIVTTKGEYKDVTLPTVVQVKRRHLNGQRIRVTSPNYAFHDVVLRKQLNEWGLLSAYLYVLPLGVDLLTNAVSKPMQKQFHIYPVGTSAIADSLHRADSVRMEAYAEMRRKAKALPAKYRRHELSGGIGFGGNQADHSTRQMINGYMERYNISPDGGCGDIFGDAYLLANLEYHYRLNRKWDIGMMAAWGASSDSYSDDYYYYKNLNDSPNETPQRMLYADGSEQSRYFVVAPSVRYTWHEQYYGRIYSRASLGLMRHHLSFRYGTYLGTNAHSHAPNPFYTDNTSDIKWRLAYQVTVVGGSLGPDSFHFFGEVGYGCLGVVRLGFSVSF